MLKVLNNKGLTDDPLINSIYKFDVRIIIFYKNSSHQCISKQILAENQT